MPTGVLQWYEPATGEARVVRQGREFPVPSGELDRSARSVGSRVHFDIHRSEGVDYAVGVAARSGMRSARRPTWTNVDLTAPEPHPPSPQLDLVVLGTVPDSAVDYARQRIGRLLDKIDEPVLHARIKLGQLGDPALERRWTAEAAFDLNGSMLRANVAGHAPNEAVDLLIVRIQDRLEHRRDRENRRPTSMEAEPGEWRHGNLPTFRPPFVERPRDECELVRHKTVADEPVTVEEAAWDMSQLDYDVYLFRELGTGADCALRSEEDGLHLAVLGAGPVPATGTVVVRVSSTVPRLNVHEAIDWLDGSGSRFVFFENARTGRGNVLYRRNDGNFGVITPSTESLDADHEDLTLAADL